MNDQYYILTADGELYHYGVKGMKWGVRRALRKQARASKLMKKKSQARV